MLNVILSLSLHSISSPGTSFSVPRHSIALSSRSDYRGPKSVRSILPSSQRTRELQALQPHRLFPQLPLRTTPTSITPATTTDVASPRAPPSHSHNGPSHRFSGLRPPEHRLQAREAHCGARDPVAGPGWHRRPGAGECQDDSHWAARSWYVFGRPVYVHGNFVNQTVGKGTQAPRIKDKFCACHLVRLFGR